MKLELIEDQQYKVTLYVLKSQLEEQEAGLKRWIDSSDPDCPYIAKRKKNIKMLKKVVKFFSEYE